MGTPLRVLCVEDTEHDTLLMLRHLRQEGYDPISRRVETAEAMIAALEEESWEVLVVDYAMPRFSAQEALKIVQERGLDLPFLVVSGTMGEDVAVEMMKAGAHDYMMKSNLARLAPAIRRELREAEVRRQRRLGEEEIRRLNAELEERVRQRTAQLEATNCKLEHEIAERKKVEEALREAKASADAANQAKGHFLANTSHELRTPMNAILGMTELALEEELSPAVRDCLQTVKDSADNLLALLNDILDFSRIESGRLTLESIPFSLRKVFRETMKALRMRADEKGLDVACDVTGEVPERLIGDPLRLRQVLTNLVGNAIKFTPKGDIFIRAEVESQDAEEVVMKFAVSDTGIGISQEDQEKVFAPFRQADSSTTRKFGGTGLGLSITADLVRLMGGRISLQSKPGKGTTFSFTARFQRKLDRSPDAERTADRVDAVATGAARGPAERSLRVLLAEDIPANQKLVVRILNKREHVVEVAGDGREAVEKVQQGEFDLVLMDVQMPILDGFEATAAIRALDGKGRVPIVAMTAHAMKGDEERCLKAGMDAYLAKPINSQELIAVVESLAKGSASPEAPATT